MKLHNIKKDQLTGRWLVKGRDPYLSGWGQAASGFSWCAWAFSDYQAAQAFEKLLRCIGCFQYVGISRWPYRPRNAAHFSVYDGDSHIIRQGDWLAVEYGDYRIRFAHLSR